MTEKRFTHKEDDWEIFEDGKHLAFAHSGYNAQKIIEKLNQLNLEKISFANELNKFESELEKTLQKHYNYAENQRLKYLDNAAVYTAYNMLRVTIIGIAEELEVELNVK